LDAKAQDYLVFFERIINEILVRDIGAFLDRQIGF